jgi:hypothetical protein
VESYPTRHRRPLTQAKAAAEGQVQAIRFLLGVIDSTIYSSAADYAAAVDDFFPQLQALGHLIGARHIDDVSDFLRQHSRMF